jgi:malonate transporter and related proteins
MVDNIALAIWPLYFVLALGFFAGKRGTFPADAVVELNKLAITFALPSSLFVSTATMSRSSLFQDLPSLAAVLVSYISVYLLAVGIVHLRFKRTLPEAAIAGICAAGPAGPLFGPAVLPPLFGPTSIVAVAIVALVLNLVQNPIAFALLGSGDKPPRGPQKSRGVKFLNTVKGVVIEPVVWAPLLGLALVLLGIPLSKILIAGFQSIGSTSAGIGIFATGLTLASSGFELSKEVITGAALKMIVTPAAVLAVGFLFGVRGAMLSEIVVVSALSSGLLATMLSSTKGIYVQQAASVTMLTSVSLVVFLPIWIFISQKISGG